MLEIFVVVAAIIVIIIVIIVVAWIFLRPKRNHNTKDTRHRKADRPGEKRVSNVPANRDPKIEEIGKAVINSSDRRRGSR
jgi:heme/copper-type cytochrome/quinol oxidase subunit 2